MEPEEELINMEDDGFTVDAELTVSIFDRIRKYLFYFGIGLLSFFLGIIIFFPSKKLPAYLFSILRESEINISTEEASLSIGGHFIFDNLQYMVSRPTTLQDLTITQVEGDIALFKYIFSEKIESTLSAIGVRIDFGEKGSLSGGEYSASIDINNIKKPISERVGSFHFEIKNAGISTSLMGSDFAFSINSGEIGGDLKLGTIHFTQGKIETRSGTILIQGSIGMSGQLPLNLKLIVSPNENLYAKSEMLNKELLQSMNALQPDGTIIIKITGSMNNPAFKIEKVNPSTSLGNPERGIGGRAPVLGP